MTINALEIKLASAVTRFSSQKPRKRQWHLKQERRRNKARAIKAAAMCQRCPKPGSCCRRIVLWTARGPFPATKDLAEAQEMLDSSSECYPFEIYGYGTTASGEPMWVLRCKMVTPEGRCGIYEYRPELGRSFQPGGDALCIQDPDPGGYRGSIMKRVTKIIAEEGTTLTSIQDLIKEAAQKGDAE